MLLVGTVVLVAALGVPRLTGSTPYVVASGSMTPALPRGTLVVVRPVPAEDVRVGDVVTYQLRSGAPEVATHRVSEVVTDPQGGVRYRTQGDANAAPDPDWVRPVQLRGRVWYHLPWVGHLGLVLPGPARLMLSRVVGASLLGYALVLLVRRNGTSRAALVGVHTRA